MNAEELAAAITELASKAFTRQELANLTDRQCSDYETLLGNRLLDDSLPPVTVMEAVGIKELLLEHLYHPALGRGSS
jgi:hypothetical protein